MKITYICIGLLSISMFSSCAEEDKKVESTSTTDGPKVIIDSTGLKGANGANNNMPLAANQQNLQNLVNNTGQQTKTLTVPSQTSQVSTVPVQQQIQQQIQQQMQQQQAAKAQQINVSQPQQVQANPQSAHPQFSAEEFKKMQDDAKKRGVSLNPAHGQPNHRCDIYVGQPLDSKPVAGLSQPAQATTATASAPQVITATPQPVKTEPGMNPPHGQPGHRCDIEVGKPLNSKPLPTTPAAATAVDSAKGGK